MRIMWSSNAPWAPSGYGTQSRELLYRFIADGWQTAASCFYGLEGGMLNLNGLSCFPKIGQPYGADALLLHSREYKADVAFTFQDIWPMDAGNLFTLASERKWIPYVPIDWYPVARNVVERLRKAYRIVTYSKSGQDELRRVGLQSTLIPHAVNTEIFKPVDKAEVRKSMNIPEDTFLFGMVAANKDDPPRKAFQQVLDAFKMFLEKHPKSALYIHTIPEQQGGFNIKGYAEHLGIQDKIFHPQPYEFLFKISHEQLAKAMGGFDVLLSPSLGEGFGLPIIESQSCGVPAIVNNWSSMPELVIPGKTGFICDTGYKMWAPIQSYKALPDVDSLYDCMEKSYRMDRKKAAVDCRQHVLKNYDMAKMVKYKWLPFLEKIQEEILPVKANPEIVKAR